MNAASTSQGNNRSNPQSISSSNDNGGPHHLSARDAALRGASMAFSKQQQQQKQQQQKQQQQQHTGTTTQPDGLAPSPNLPAPTPQRDNSARTAAESATKTRSPTGSVSGRAGNKAARQAAGGGGIGALSRQTTGSSRGGDESERERERERLALFLSSPGSPYVLSPPGGSNSNNSSSGNRGANKASFIAATLAASRSVSPSPAGQGGGENGNNGVKRAPLGEPANIRRGGSVRTASPEVVPSTRSLEDLMDTKSLAPMTSLISMFETRRDVDMDPVKSSPDRRIKKKAKPPKPKPKALKAVGDDGHPAAIRSQDGHGQSSKQKPPAPPTRKSSASVKIRPEASKSAASPERPPLRSRELNAQSRPLVSTGTDGQDSTKPTSPEEDTEDARPASAGSMSSNDSFVSASSTPTRADSPPFFDPASRSLVSRSGHLHRATSLKPTPSMPILRRTVTGSSQLTVDSLSSAMVAGSLASARHTPAPISDARTPPPIPPSRRQGGKSNTTSRKSSPHRMKQTLRQARAISDDEEARRPHHKKKLINKKKHTHHEGSRRRWRNEITEREKKRYEAVWASNRGLFLVQSAQACSDPSDPDHPPAHHHHRGPGQIVRTESYEELSEHVPSVVVRDIWGRSRLPAAELAEVWDLVYGRTGRVHAALNKAEFVVGMWLIDQRLRGRKIPTTVSDSVWDSAKGLRMWSPDQQHGHGHGHGHVGKGKGKGK